MSISRRGFFTAGTLLGCSLAASPLLTPLSFAAAPWEARLVVIVLRGGMDGLDVVQPYGDRFYKALRPTLVGGPETGALDLDGFFSMHPALAPLLPLWQRQELGFLHAVSTPYRDKRSHFDGQDLLEAGTLYPGQERSGWLNRLMQTRGGINNRTGFAIGQGALNLMRGSAPVAEWSPDVDLPLSPQARDLAGMLMREDPLFHAAFQEALDLAGTGLRPETGVAGTADPEGAMAMALPQQPSGSKLHQRIAEFTAQQLRQETRIAAFSLNGWDSHSRQQRGLSAGLSRLSDVILTLRADLGPQIWSKTAVLAVTEFGRTVRENGTKGTDHGTAGAMIMAGGAIEGGKVHGHWPGLAEADLYDRRDLMPTGDLRAGLGAVLQGLTGVGQADLERIVFPGLDMAQAPRLLRA